VPPHFSLFSFVSGEMRRQQALIFGGFISRCAAFAVPSLFAIARFLMPPPRNRQIAYTGVEFVIFFSQ